MRFVSYNPPAATSRGSVPLPSAYKGVEYARRYVSEHHVPDSMVLEESLRFIKETVGDCRIYGIGQTSIGYVDRTAIWILWWSSRMGTWQGSAGN